MSSNPGAGDILMGFLGSVILSFAFSMFKQRKVITKTLHIMREIFSSCSIYRSSILMLVLVLMLFQGGCQL